MTQILPQPATRKPVTEAALEKLQSQLSGSLFTDRTLRTLYATDASAYREMPLAVALPVTEEDLTRLVHFAREYQTSLIPRTAGTSLAGQVVGNGIIVDVSKHFTRILEVNKAERWVRLQPGVVRDELNMYLKPYGLYFGPETSTANRAMIGGMVGNNSCGSNSLIYGSTRDHLLEVKAILSDCSEVTFRSLSAAEFEKKCEADSLEGRIYRNIRELLSDEENRQEIEKEFPLKSIPRRNTGYAIDLLAELQPFNPEGQSFNFCKLIAGSEGTLAFLTEIKLSLSPLPPAHKGLVCIHCHSVDESLRANLVALRFAPSACELMDHYVLECTKSNIEQRQNRFFVEGDPGAILAVELSCHSAEELQQQAQALIEALRQEGYGYHYPFVTGPDIKKVWDLRKAGLGLLSNIPGDSKPVAVIEDTAVDVNQLPEYIAEFNAEMARMGLYCVHYAHAGSGELHLRPILNLKTAEGNQLFRQVAEVIARLVKKYKGSLSGEHGDGRLRGEFIPFMIGEKNYRLLEQIKHTWDPYNLFNPGKIVGTPPMNTFLRFEPGQPEREIQTVFDWSESQGILRAAELCNGSGDCRKSELTGGTMCPSYMATRNEKDTTRARANILREMLTHSTHANPFSHHEIKEVMDLCLSCKGCKSECPSNVDVAKMKAEFLQQYYDAKGVPLRARLFGNYAELSKLASLAPWLYNFFFTNPLTAGLARHLGGFAPKRSVPLLHPQTLRKWFEKHAAGLQPAPGTEKGQVIFFCDEFTNFNDTPVGITAIRLLTALGYRVHLPAHAESGRAPISKGLLRKARRVARANIAALAPMAGPDMPVIGLEPSAILTLRDEYLSLSGPGLKARAEHLAAHTFLIDEFLARQADKGNIRPEQFTQQAQLIKLHGHCHQKALSSLTPTKKILSLPKNYQVHLIRSGCCGMAGSFGYEEEHYEISMKIGELVLFPAVRELPEEVMVAAPGTSCRHQIKDGTGKVALHPVEILWQALDPSQISNR